MTNSSAKKLPAPHSTRFSPSPQPGAGPHYSSYHLITPRQQQNPTGDKDEAIPHRWYSNRCDYLNFSRMDRKQLDLQYNYSANVLRLVPSPHLDLLYHERNEDELSEVVSVRTSRKCPKRGRNGVLSRATTHSESHNQDDLKSEYSLTTNYKERGRNHYNQGRTRSSHAPRGATTSIHAGNVTHRSSRSQHGSRSMSRGGRERSQSTTTSRHKPSSRGLDRMKPSSHTRNHASSQQQRKKHLKLKKMRLERQILEKEMKKRREKLRMVKQILGKNPCGA